MPKDDVFCDSPMEQSGKNVLASLALPVYLPAFFLAAGDGAMSTFLPLFLMKLGTSAAGAALLVGIGTAGVLLFDLPSGFIVARYGERRVLALSGAAIVAAGLLIAVSPTPGVATAGVFLLSGAASFWLLGRLEFMRKALTTSARGRGLATVGGVMRGGLLLGPLAGGLLVQAAGYRVVFLSISALGALSLVLFLSSAATRSERGQTQGEPAFDTSRRTPQSIRASLARVIRMRARVLTTAGTSMLILAMLRSGRSLLLPLWGQGIGLDAASIGLVVGISAAGDTLLFYPAGLVSDRRGRKWSAVSCLVALSVGLAIIPLAHTLTAFALAGLLVGLGNGMGSGINMTLGADFATRTEPGVFLGLWRLVTDIGVALAPVAIGVVAGALALGPAAVVIAALGLAGAGFHAAVVPETLRKRRPAS